MPGCFAWRKHRILTDCILSVCIICISFNLSYGQDILIPVSVNEPLVIDGVFDEEIWLEAPEITGFHSYLPDYTGLMEDQTFVKMVYDSENLYFGFRCLDSEPDKIKATMAPRDKIFDDDWVCVNLDSFNDEQGLYTLYINPYGIQQDGRFGGGQEDPNFDMVWYSAGNINEEGYNVEVRIPLKSIRYASSDTITMGVVFERFISRKPEAGTFPPLDPNVGMNFSIQMMPVQYTGLKNYTLLEVLPAITYKRNYELNKFDLDLKENKAEFSLTTKWGITSDLILDATYNPDFSQVEADAQQVDINLRHTLFFPEKRPFFMEGMDNFNIGAMRSSEVDPLKYLIYTRTIVYPKVGAKLTGKAGKKNTFATLYALDELPGESQNERAHFGIFRYKRTLHSDSYIGGVYAGEEQTDSYNRLGGFDGMIRINKSRNIGFDGLVSYIKPDDTTGGKRGYTTGLVYRQYKRLLDFQFAYREISKDFTANMGYIIRTGIRSFSGLLRPKVYPDQDWLNRIVFEVFSAQTQDLFCYKWETFNHVSGHVLLKGNLSLILKYIYSTEIYLCKRFETGGINVYAGGQFHKRISMDLLYRRKKSIYYSDDPYQGVSNQLTIGLNIQPHDNFNASLSYIYFDFARNWHQDKIYKYPIGRLKLLYQANKFLFFRAIFEYNRYHKQWLTDFLISFTYIPGTVLYLGYGSLYESIHWNGIEYVENNRFLKTYRGFFVKASYLFRL